MEKNVLQRSGFSTFNTKKIIRHAPSNNQTNHTFFYSAWSGLATIIPLKVVLGSARQQLLPPDLRDVNSIVWLHEKELIALNA